MTAAQIVRLNADALGVKPPKLVYVTADRLPTPTTQAAVSDDGTEIAVNRSQLFRFIGPAGDLNLTLVLSHEMRHVWQLRTGWNPMHGYSPSSDLPLDEYNAQSAEVDAWAWSAIVVEDLFGVTPQLGQLLGPEIQQKVNTRAAQIRAEA